MAVGEQLEERFSELRTSLEALPTVSEPPKSILRILGSARSEQEWNTLLAYYLDPTQPHGFEADLLKSFLDTVEQETSISIGYFHRHLESIDVETEVTSPADNRPDIVIRVPGEWFICIELKVEASEGAQQTHRYVEDSHIGNEEKDEYPEGGRHYLFISKEHAPNSNAHGFDDLYWRHIVAAFESDLKRSHGRYPERSVSQLREFLSTIITVTSMEDDEFTQLQKEKIRLLAEYRSDIDELLAAAESLRERAIEDWPDLFRSHVNDELWTDDWHTRPDHAKWGCIFRTGWYRDDAELEPTLDYKATHGSTGFRLHFIHLIRNPESFAQGQLTFLLCSPTSVELRDEFNEVYNSERWQSHLNPILNDAEITNKGNKRDYTEKTYDVDQSELPESYFETLAIAFEEHQPLAEAADEILEEALENVHTS